MQADLGESDRVISCVQQQLINHLGTAGESVYDRFLREAGGAKPTPQNYDGVVRMRLRHAQPIKADLSVSTADRSKQASFGTERVRRWTMNSNLDYYIKTNETSRRINLSLNYRHSSGHIENVGFSAFDLADLAQQGIVSRRGGLFDIKIERDGGCFWIGVRRVSRLPLENFRR